MGKSLSGMNVLPIINYALVCPRNLKMASHVHYRYLQNICVYIFLQYSTEIPAFHHSPANFCNFREIGTFGSFKDNKKYHLYF